jgi:hypothetical protein
MEVVRQEDRTVEAETAEQDRHDQRLRERERPRDQPAEERPEAAADVRVHAARGRQMKRQLAHRVGGEQHGNHRKHDGQRRDPARERRRGADGEGRGDRRRHVRDGLEQELRDADRVSLEALAGRGRRRRHGLGHPNLLWPPWGRAAVQHRMQVGKPREGP